MEERIKNPIYKRWWFIVGIILVIVIGVGGALTGGDDNLTADTNTPVAGDEDQAYTNDDASEDKAAQEPAAETPSATMGEKNALETADSYLRLTAFSYSGLVDQLEFEGYSNAEATYAADNCGADWNEQAAIKAQEYIDMMAFSRQGLIDQLKFEGFSDSQAQYGADAVGY